MSNNHRDLTSPTLDFGIQKNFVTPAITGFDSIFTPLDFSKLLPELFEGSGLSESDGIFKKISEIGGLFDDLGVNSSFKTFESFIPGIQQYLLILRILTIFLMVIMLSLMKMPSKFWI